MDFLCRIWSNYISIIKYKSIIEAYGFWFVVFLFLLLFLYIQKNNCGGKFICKFELIYLLICFNPIVTLIIAKCLQKEFWRTFWGLNIPIVIACSICFVFEGLKSAKKKQFLIIWCLFIILLTGKNMFEYNYSRAENLYKMPQEVIDCCDYIERQKIDGLMLADVSLSLWIRQYDVNIETLYTRTWGSTVFQSYFDDGEYYSCIEFIDDNDVSMLLVKKDKEFIKIAKNSFFTERWSNDKYVLLVRESD